MPLSPTDDVIKRTDTVVEKVDTVIERTSDNRFTLVHRRQSPGSEPSIHLDVRLAALCGTDIQIMRGLRQESATILGHEALCIVAAIDPDIETELEVGDAVVVNPTSKDDPDFLLGHNVPGVFQSRISLPRTALELGQVVRLPVVPPGLLSVLIEPLACVLYALSTLEAFEPERFVIFGDGTIGRLAQIVLTQRGFDPEEIRVVSRAEFARLQEWRAPDLSDFLARVHTGIVLATPRDSTLDCLERVLVSAGRESAIDVIGGFDVPDNDVLLRVNETRSSNVAGGPVPAVVYRHDRNDPNAGSVVVTGHRGVSAEHLRAAARLLSDRASDFESLITHLVDPDEAVEVFNELALTGRRTYHGRRIIKMAIRMSEKEGQES